MPNSVLTLCKTLIKQASVTPDDAQCQAILSNILQGLNFSITSYPKNNVSNIWAYHGNQNASPLLVFAGHTDVVPPGASDTWQQDPFSPTERNGLLYGRGAADMKGALAAMTIAAKRFVTKHPNHRGRLGFLFTSDEEGDATDGTRYVIEQLQKNKEEIDYCIVGEPSSQKHLGDQIRIGRRGSLHARLTVKGKQGHVAYPTLALNPIHALAPALLELTQTVWDDGDENFPPTTCQCSNIRSGVGASNVIPETLQLQFNFRFSTQSSPEQLQERVETLLKNHGLSFSIDWTLSAIPFISTPGKLRETTLGAIKKHTERAPMLSTSGGTSDGRFIAPLGTEVIELGPVNATIHQVDECVCIADLETLALIYETIMMQLLT